MGRRQRCRIIHKEPGVTAFKPVGVPASRLDCVNITVDELEAIRLADLEGLYQEEASKKMSVSRQTFGRIVGAAHRKIGEALVNGKIIIVKGGNIEMAAKRTFKCSACEHVWEESFGTGRPQQCPECGGTDFHRIDDNVGSDRGQGGERCRHREGNSHESD
jgi:predicted DNA-binding protein (UPF0251 family)/rubredoxin